MNPLSLLGPSWLPKIGGLIAALGAALRLAPLATVSSWAPMVETLGLGILGFTVRQNNVSSEQAGAKPQDAAAAAAIKNIVGIVLLVGLAIGSAGCASLLPGNDPVVVRAQQTEQIAFTTFDTYVHIEDKYRTTLWTVSHDFKRVADKIRTGAPEWFKSFDAVLDAYKAHRTSQNKASLAAGLAALEQSVSEAQGYLARAVEEGAKP